MNTTAGANVTLDRAGQCCSEGLDACGVCGGNGLTIDFTGTCCNGAVDASGLCCALPHVVDDFGVCAGNSSTGVIVLNLDVLSTTLAGQQKALLVCLPAVLMIDKGWCVMALPQGSKATCFVSCAFRCCAPLSALCSMVLLVSSNIVGCCSVSQAAHDGLVYRCSQAPA